MNFFRNHPKLVAAARIIFAGVALVIVVCSVQFHDNLVKGKERFQIIKTDKNFFYIPGKTVSRQDPSYKYQAGAISLARNIRFLPALIGVSIFAVVPIILSYRWQILLKVQGVHIPFWKVVQLSYMGHFLNFFLIGTTGGDLVKAYWIGRFSPKRAEGFVSVFVDRIIGLVVLILMAAVFVLFMWHDPQVAKLSRAVGSLVVLAAVGILFLFSRRLRQLFRFDRWKGKLPISRLVDQIDQSLLAYRRSSRSLILAAGATVLLQFLSSTASYFLGSALQVNAAVWYYWLYVPLAFLIGSIPVSVFWGLGLLEGAYVGFFAGSGFASVTQAAMLAMAVRLMQLFWSLPGSLVVAVGIGKKDE
jgi:glycosyltransferase 2 family protein